MANLRPIEIKLVDELTGMSSGYVLDFSNRTLLQFLAPSGRSRCWQIVSTSRCLAREMPTKKADRSSDAFRAVGGQQGAP